jgi:hypothetical protein
MPFVSPFLRNAHAIFATAREAAGNGQAEDSGVAILIEADGSLRMCPSAGWDLECLRRHHGAAMVYGVTRSGSQVRVEARSRAERCTLETGGAAQLAGLGMETFPQYQLIS